MATEKTKSMKSNNSDDRKLATGAGRAKAKSGGEPKKDNGAPRGSARRTGSSRQTKS